jgi:hypothetical protein
VNGLYYVGAGTHPGGGIPGVLLGAEVTTNLVRADLRAGRIRPAPGQTRGRPEAIAPEAIAPEAIAPEAVA